MPSPFVCFKPVEGKGGPAYIAECESWPKLIGVGRTTEAAAKDLNAKFRRFISSCKRTAEKTGRSLDDVICERRA